MFGRNWSLPLVAALLLLSGCTSLASSTSLAISEATPNPQLGPPRALQQLNFSGDLSGIMTTLITDDDSKQSECSGPTSRGSGVWASTLYGHLGQQVYGVVFLIKPYRGPGTYEFPNAKVEISDPTSSQVWQSADGNQSELRVDSEQLSGSVQATLVNASSNHPSLQVSGQWSCRPA